jgi:hypothetical protein
MLARPWMLLVALGLTNCGDGGAAPLAPLEACQKSAEINCSKAYECLDPADLELIGFPASREECLAQLTAACAEEPEEEFCADGTIYDRDAAGECMAARAAVTCEQVFDETEDDYAPACAAMCRPPA